MTLQSRIEAAISSKTGKEAEFADSKTAQGGCINDSQIVTLKDGQSTSPTRFKKTQKI